MKHKENRIQYLIDKYGETKIAPYECLSKDSRAKINQQYYKNNIQKNRVQQILNETNTTKQIKSLSYITKARYHLIMRRYQEQKHL